MNKVLILLGCLALSHGLPVDEELDTEFIDATTVSSNTVEVEPTLAPVLFANEDEIVIDATDSHSGNGRECTTARGLKGVCSPVQDCLKVLFPVDYANRTSSQGPPYNEELAMMLVERSGFCEGNEKNARHDVTPGVFRQVMRSEVQICCKVDEPHEFKLDEVPEKPFKADGCGAIKISLSELTLNDTEDVTMPIIQNLTEVDRIVKGRKTKPGEFPWMVAMMNRDRQFCGGSLINSRTVLTAAHCVEQMSANDVKNLKLQLGDWNIYSKADGAHVVRTVSAVKYHKGFSQKHLRNDIALLIMDKPVQYTNRIQPVCLHTGNPSVDTGSMQADVAGWGALSEGGKQPSDLRAVSVRVLTRGQCRQKYSGNANKISDGMVCAGSDNGEDSCQGDSGGPLTIDSRSQAKQIGVVSWGIGCGRYPGVYTAVYRYLAWVDKHKGV